MSYVIGLKCRECGRLYPKEVIFVCEFCFGSVEVEYDYDAIRRSLTTASLAARPKSLWRYRELLPIEGEPTAGLDSGFTPFFRAERLAEALGVEALSTIPFGLRAEGHEILVSEPMNGGVRLLVRKRALVA